MKRPKKRLRIAREFVRVLTDLEIERGDVVGGGSQIQTCSLCKPPLGVYCCSDALG